MVSSSLKILFAGLIIPTALAAQQRDVRGRVLLVAENDTVPVAGEAVTIHRVGISGGAPVDSAVTDRNGRYMLRGIPMDTLALFVVSADYAGIAYFSSPVPASGDSAGLALPLLVYDTASVGPPITTFQRHVIASPTEDGQAVGVLELLIVDNPTALTRVVTDSGSPVWTGRIPAEALQFQVGEGEVGATSITRQGDVVAVTAPIPPGRRQIVYSYILPLSVETAPLEVVQPVSQMNVLIDVRTNGRLTGGLVDIGAEQIGTQTYRHYQGADVEAGLSLALQFPGPPLDPADFVPWFAAIVAVAMLGTLLWRLRRDPPAVAVAAPPVLNPDVLATRIAGLDRQFETIESPNESQTNSYRSQRDELKALLSRALADRDGGA